MSENTKIDKIDFAGIPVKERIYEWNKFENMLSPTKYDMWFDQKFYQEEHTSSSIMEEQCAHISVVEQTAFTSDNVQYAFMGEDGQLSSSSEDEWRVSSTRERHCISNNEKEYSVASFQEKHVILSAQKENKTPPLKKERALSIKHNRHSSIQARYLIDQEILAEIKLVHKYLELNRRDSILKKNRLSLYKESRENIEETNVEKFVDNVFAKSSALDSSNGSRSRKLMQRKQEKSNIPEYRSIKAVETVKKKKGFFCSIFRCLTL